MSELCDWRESALKRSPLFCAVVSIWLVRAQYRIGLSFQGCISLLDHSEIWQENTTQRENESVPACILLEYRFSRAAISRRASRPSLNRSLPKLAQISVLRHVLGEIRP